MTAPAASAPAILGRRRRLRDRVGDALLVGVTFAAGAFAVLLLVAIAYKVVQAAGPAYDKFGLGFLTGRDWDPVKNAFGALDLIFGTAVTSVVALVIATPLSIAIGLFLSELAPSGVRGVIGALVEMLAAVPSVVLGLWGILVLGPFIQDTLGPALQKTLGFLPIFEGTPQGSSVLTASIVLTIMVVPIVASICRELFLSVPSDLEEGALALGLTRWEMIRGVVLPYTRGGVLAAVALGFGRAVGEAIAVTQVIGGQLGIHASLFVPGDTLASRIAAQYQGAVSHLQVASLVYLAVILLAITLIVNLGAQLIVRRFEYQRTGGT